MKKRLLALFMSLCLVVGLLPTAAWAEEDEDGTKEHPWNVSAEGEDDHVTAYLEQNNDDNENPTYTLTISGSGEMKDFSWSTVDSQFVSDEPWLNMREAITEVCITDGITYVGQRTLNKSTVKKLTIADSVTEIGDYAFASNPSLTDVELGTGLSSLGRGSFIANSNLEKITLPLSITTIGGQAFDSTALTDCNLETCQNLATIGNLAFHNTNLTSVTIPSSVKTLSQEAFKDCTKLESVTFGANDSLDMKWSIFKNCTSLKTVDMSKVNANSSSWGELPFSDCTQLKTVLLPNGNSSTTLPYRFLAQSGVEVIEVPKNITSWGQQLFWECKNLKAVVIHASSLTLGSSIFLGDDQTVILYCIDSNIVNAFNGNKHIVAGTDGGTFSDDTKFEATKLATPIKAGCTFGGWYADPAFAEDKKLGDNETPVADTTYYAKWQARELDEITVAPKADAKFAYGDALTAADFVVTEVYDNGETEIVSPENYTVSPDKLETVGSVVVTVTCNDNPYTCTINVSKATQAAPAAPELADRTYTSITLETVEGAEYRCGDGAWKTSPEFTGLTAGTTYTFQVRYAETDTHAASEPSEAAEFATLAQTSSGGGGSSRNNSYAVSTPKADNGSVTVNNGSTAKKGDTVTITVKPDSGYEIDKVTVTDSKGNSIAVTDKGDGKYSFTMPDSKVDVKATFVKAEVKPDQPSKTGFVDVPDGIWYEDAANFVAERGLMSGVGENLFGGNQNTTRAMLMTILARMDGQDVTGGATWYEKAMNWAKQTGVSDGTMPEVNITREQLATMLYSYAKLKGLDTTQGGMAVREFADYDSISAWAGQSMTWAVNAGILSGRGNNTLAPTAGATRAEMAVMLQQFVKLMEK